LYKYAIIFIIVIESHGALGDLVSLDKLGRKSMARIMKVTSVTATILKSSPAALVIQAAGEVNTSGWKNIELSPYIYVKPPSDGIWDFDFSGTPPSGIVLPVLLPVHASSTLPLPNWCKGVRIHAAQNSMEASLSTAGAEFLTV
jgi:hypothetical protein